MVGRRHELKVQTRAKTQVVDITALVQEAVHALGLEQGAVLLFCPHTTAALTVNEAADPDVRSDVNEALNALVPRLNFRHGEGNSPAHFLSSLMGPSLVLPVEGGRVVLGTWQGVYFCEFDGPRTRSVWAYALG